MCSLISKSTHSFIVPGVGNENISKQSLIILNDTFIILRSIDGIIVTYLDSVVRCLYVK